MRKVAAIDVGSNAIRFLIAGVTNEGIVGDKILKRYALRLGTDVFQHGKILTAQRQKLELIFKRIAKTLNRQKIQHYRAVATSAMRDAKNGTMLTRQLYKKTGLRLEVIRGGEEAALARQSLERVLGGIPKHSLLLDLGGGSLEIEHTKKSAAASLPLGAVRLMQRYPLLKGALSEPDLARLRLLVARDIGTHLKTRVGKAKMAVGIGGSFEVLIRLLPKAAQTLPHVDLRRLPSFTQTLAAQSPRQRQKAYQLRKDRADVILPALLVIEALIELYQVENLIVPGTGLRDALIYQQADKIKALKPT